MKQRLNNLTQKWRNSSPTQKALLIIVVLLVPAILIPLFIWGYKKFFNKTDKEDKKMQQIGQTPKPKGTAEATLKKLWKDGTYPKSFLARIEQALRNETAHFKSGQWLRSGTAGMETSPRTSTKFPFGWSSLDKYAKAHGRTKDDFFYITMKDNHDGYTTNFVGFKETGFFVEYMCYFLWNVRGGEVEAWNRLTQEGKKAYGKKLDGIKNKWIV